MRRTKIIATLGPSSCDTSTLRALLLAGVDVLRVNFSHAGEDIIQAVWQAQHLAKELNKPLAIMADLQGPKLRIGRFESGQIRLNSGQTFVLSCEQDFVGDEHRVSVAYPELINDVHPGDELLLDDGLITLRVQTIEKLDIVCEVLEGGILKDKKGLNRKGGGLSAPAITEKDIRDLDTALAMGIDYLTLSFVRDARDVLYAQTLLEERKAEQVAIIAKIERTEALHNLAEIVETSDAVMVARGDLGVEIGAAEVPAMQKRIIREARQKDKMVITATQMMESMIQAPLPTRAEVSDVANAILDGTDAVMLSAETATGKHPVKVIDMVNAICISAEKHAEFDYAAARELRHYHRIDQAIAMAAMHTANRFPVQAIVALTESGASAVWMSRHQSRVPIFAVTPNPKTYRRLALANNVYPVLLAFHEQPEDKAEDWVLEQMLAQGMLQKQGYILRTRGQYIGQTGGANNMEIIAL